MISNELQACLDELGPLYDQVQELRKLWSELQTLDQARNDYEKATAEFESPLFELRSRREQLKNEKTLLIFEQLETDDTEQPFPSSSNHDPQRISTLYQKKKSGSAQSFFDPVVYNRLVHLAARRQLQKLVGRFATVWLLDIEVVSQINQIASDPDRELGEALALLGWEQLYVQKLPTSENDSVHLERLNIWKLALSAYHKRLEGDIDTLKTQYRPWLKIWERWRKRNFGYMGWSQWQQLIKHTQEDAEREANSLRDEIVRLENDIDLIKKRLNK